MIISQKQPAGLSPFELMLLSVIAGNIPGRADVQTAAALRIVEQIMVQMERREFMIALKTDVVGFEKKYTWLKAALMEDAKPLESAIRTATEGALTDFVSSFAKAILANALVRLRRNDPDESKVAVVMRCDLLIPGFGKMQTERRSAALMMAKPTGKAS